MVPLIYNLFPTLVGPVTEWVAHARRARRMGFNWLYVNPFLYPGFSGSLYAIKDHRRLPPAVEPPGSPPMPDTLRAGLEAIRAVGLEVMVDLVVNHTSKDSPLVAEHPEWFQWDAAGQVVSPSVADPDDTRKVTVWGDLAQVDNAGSRDRDGLWRFWEELVDWLLDLGVTGFRCDAAYKVPAPLWERLMTRARERVPQALFVAETLGCTLDAMAALRA